MGSLSKKLKSGAAVLGTFISLGHPSIVELAGASGFDFVVVDMEHSCMGTETVENLVRAAGCVNLDVIVRIPHVTEGLIGRLLDAGASGVQVPQVTTRKYAEQAVQAAKYPPVGSRGYMPVNRAFWSRNLSKDAQIARANEESIVVAQVEGKEGLSRVDQILETPDLDVVFLGPYDLSMSLGVPGQVNHPDVLQAMETVVGKAQRASIAVGVFADDAAAARRWMAQGVSYITVGLDATYLASAYRRCTADMKGVS
ncbi:MAG: HpcH/HpaI aldolase family protein [Bacillota bacterium]